MTSTQIEKVNEEFVFAMNLTGASILPMVLKAFIDLNLFEIMAKAAGPNANFLSPTEIASHLGTNYLDAPIVLDRLLRFLTSHSVLKCVIATQDDDQVQRRYGLNPVCKFLTKNEDGLSLAPLLLWVQDKVYMESWYHLKDQVKEGGIAFNRVHGMTAFEYAAIDHRFNSVFNKAMSDHTTMTIKKMLETYKGFEGIKQVVDVGGGVGATLQMITSKYPHIKGINFDLPHVLAVAPSYPGVEHVGGDMFVSVPRGEAIFMKWILHDWDDDHCLKLLKNCFEALSNSGKVIVIESILPENPENYSSSNNTVFWQDVVLLSQYPGGKERTEKEFQALAKRSGFATCEIVCCINNCCVLEFHK